MHDLPTCTRTSPDKQGHIVNHGETAYASSGSAYYYIEARSTWRHAKAQRQDHNRVKKYVRTAYTAYYVPCAVRTTQ